jgi:hypothetical protein
MADLSDEEAYEVLHAALLKLGQSPGKTVRANTALTAARVALSGLQMGLLAAMDNEQKKEPD